MQGVAGIEAFGKPGIEPRGRIATRMASARHTPHPAISGSRSGKGLSPKSTIRPIDRPQLRDLQYLVTDGSTFFQEEKRDLKVSVERISDHALGYRCTNADPDGRYTITKELIGDPHLPCLLHHTRITGKEKSFLANLKIFALCAPHLEIGGAGNNGYIGPSPMAGES